MPDTQDKARILICEDEVLIAADLESRLKRLGYTIVGKATSGEKALELVEQHQPDLVMMDIVLQGEMDGIDVAEVIRDRWSIPVVFLTAYADTDRLERAKLTYPFGYLLKPFQDRDLKITTEMALYLGKVDKERKKLEESLRESEEKYRLLFTHAPAGIFEVDFITGKFTEVNNIMCEYTGFTKNELLTMGPFDILTEESRLHFIERLEKINKGESVPANPEFCIKNKDGSIRWVKLNVNFRQHNNITTGASVIAHDITDRKEAELELQHTLDATTDGIWSWNFKTNELNFSPQYYTMLGYEPDEFPATYESWISLIHPDDLDNSLKIAEEYLNTKPDYYENEFRLKSKAGDYLWMNAKAKVVERDENGEAVRMIGCHQDITDRKEAEEALRHSEERFKLLSEASFEGIQIHEEGTIIDANQALAKILGYQSAEEIIGKNIMSKHLTPESLKKAYNSIASGKNSSYEATGIKCDGTLFPIEIVSKFMVYQDKFVRVAALRDITERKSVEEALRVSEANLSSILEAMPDLMFTLSSDGKHLDYFKPGTEQLWIQPEKFIGKSVAEVLPTEVSDLYLYHIRQALEKKELQRFEYQLEFPEGPNYYEARLVLKEENEILSVVRNITKRKQFEDALKDSEERYHQVFETNQAIKLIIDPVTGKIVEVNKSACNFYGYDKKEFLSKKITDINMAPSEQVYQEMQAAMEERKMFFNFSHLLSNGELRQVEVYSGPVTIRRGALLYSIVHDVTERKNLEIQYKDKLNQLNALFNSSLSLIMIKDITGKFLHVNRAFAESVGSTVEQLIGKSDYDLFPIELADYFREGDLSIIQNREPLITQDNVNLSGKDRYFLGTRTPLLDDNGEVYAICVITTDITEHKALEKALNHALQQKETLLKELNHRVKNNMQVIISLMRLQSDKIDDEQLKTSFLETQNRIYAMSAVHETLHQSDNLSSVDLSEYLTKLSDTTFNTYRTDGGNIQFTTEIESIPVDLEKSYPIGLVINELLSNSLKYAFPEGREGEISISGVLEDNTANLVVSDTGVGIPQDLDWRSIDSLGLQIVRSLVEDQLRGTIDLDRTHGTKWTISFPI